MALYEFSGVTVRDAQGLPAAGATGVLYDKDDATFSTPLTVTDLNGLPLTLTADQFGQLPDFQINHTEPRAVWKPSDPTMSTTALLSLDGVVEMGAAAEAAAASSASSAAASAASADATAKSVAALDSWVKLGVTRYNRVPNPGFEAGVEGVTEGGDVVVVESSFAAGVRSGTKCLAFTVGAAPSGFIYLGQDLGTVKTGDWVAVAIPARFSGTTGRFRVGIEFRNSGGAVSISRGTYMAGGATYVTPQHAAQVPQDATTARVYLYVAGTSSDTPAAATSGHSDEWIAAFATTESAALSAVSVYFDGSTPTTDLKGYAWSGTPNASVSQMIDYTVITNAATAQAQAAQDAAEASQTAAEAAASTAASLATGVVRKVNGVAPDVNGNVTVSGGGSGSAVTSVAGKTGAVSLVKGDVGLGQVDNTSDVNKPISTAVQNALNGKLGTSTAIPVSQVTGLQASLDSKSGVNDPVAASRVNAGTGTILPSKLSGVVKTVNGVSPDGAGNVNVSGGGGGGDVLSVNGKTGAVVLNAGDVDALPDTYTPPVTSVAGLTGDVVLNKTNVGLADVNNTSDADKPISTATQIALNAKADDSAVVKLTGNQTVAGTKTFSSAPVVPDGSFPLAKVAGAQAAIDAKLTGVQLTQAAYDALGTPVPGVLYLIVG